MIYLDNSATTAPAPQVLAAMERARGPLNAGSVHRNGQLARTLLEEARSAIARALGTQPRSVILTSGGTESNNTALKGGALRIWRTTGGWPHLLAPATEHHAVLHTLDYLAALGAPLTLLPVDGSGRLDPDTLRETLAALPPAMPVLVTAMHANNETGVLHPIEEIARVVRERGGALHTDAVQSVGKLPLAFSRMGVGALAASAHKIHGPRGIGLLLVDDGFGFDPLLHGGAQERRRRAGTEPVELAVGCAEAVRLAVEGMERNGTHCRDLLDRLRRGVGEIEGVRIITPEEEVLPTILSITFDDAERLDGEGLIAAMDLEGVAVSNGSACTSGSQQPSHVLLAMGRPPAEARAAVRFSLGRETTVSDIEGAVAALERVVGRMRGAGSGFRVSGSVSRTPD